MSSSDDKKFPLATKAHTLRFRRSVSVNNFTLPKPYQKRPIVEDEPQMSTTRIALLGVSGLAAAGMLAMLAMAARDNLDTKPVLVIAAPPETPVIAEEKPPTRQRTGALTAAKSISKSERPAMKALGARDYPAPRAVARPPLLAVSAKVQRPLHMPPKPEPVPHDPDVELITAILMLTSTLRVEPATTVPPVCTLETRGDTGCPMAHISEP